MAVLNDKDDLADRLARYIGEVAIPVRDENPRAPMVEGECNDPLCWIQHCAEGAADNTQSQKILAHRITRAFQERYGKHPSDAFDQVDRQAKIGHDGLER